MGEEKIGCPFLSVCLYAALDAAPAQTIIYWQMSRFWHMQKLLELFMEICLPHQETMLPVCDRTMKLWVPNIREARILGIVILFYFLLVPRLINLDFD